MGQVDDDAGPSSASDNDEFAAADQLNKDDMENVGGQMKSKENQFTKSGSSTSLSKGFTGEMHTRTIETVKDTLNVITNVEDPKDVAFAKYYATTDRPGVVGMAASGDVANPGELNIDEDTADVTANYKLFSSSMFPSAASGSQTITYSTTAKKRSMARSTKFRGSLYVLPTAVPL